MAYLLKKSRPDRFDRKPAREYKANLEIFKKKMIQEEEKESQRQAQFKNKEDEDSMNVDGSTTQTFKKKSPFESARNSKDQIDKSDLGGFIKF